MSSGLPAKRKMGSNSDHENEFGQLELQWQGPVNKNTISHILECLESRLNNFNHSTLQKKRIIRVVVELLQNLHHHVSPVSGYTRFQISSSQSQAWSILAENELSSQQQEELTRRWNDLSALSPNEWRQFQRDKLASKNRSIHGGGGMGLIEILRKTEGRVNMTFTTVKSSIIIVRFVAQIQTKNEFNPLNR